MLIYKFEFSHFFSSSNKRVILYSCLPWICLYLFVSCVNLKFKIIKYFCFWTFKSFASNQPWWSRNTKIVSRLKYNSLIEYQIKNVEQPFCCSESKASDCTTIVRICVSHYLCSSMIDRSVDIHMTFKCVKCKIWHLDVWNASKNHSIKIVRFECESNSIRTWIWIKLYNTSASIDRNRCVNKCTR